MNFTKKLIILFLSKFV